MDHQKPPLPLGTPHAEPCALCGNRLILKASPKYNRPFYGCEMWRETRCSGTVSAHKNGYPLGSPAGPELKRARMRAHDAFDYLWKGIAAPYTRSEAYQKVATALGKPEVHIGWTRSVEECNEIVRVVGEMIPLEEGWTYDDLEMLRQV